MCPRRQSASNAPTRVHTPSPDWGHALGENGRGTSTRTPFHLEENACPRSPPWSRSGQWPQWRCQFLKTQPRHIDESYNTHPWTFWPRGFSANSVLVCPAGPLLVPMRHLLRQGGAARGQALACGGAPGPQGGPTVPEAPRAPKAQSWVRLSSSPVLPRKVVGGGWLCFMKWSYL